MSVLHDYIIEKIPRSQLWNATRSSTQDKAVQVDVEELLTFQREQQVQPEVKQEQSVESIFEFHEIQPFPQIKKEIHSGSYYNSN